jgi:hypothetical protein
MQAEPASFMLRTESFDISAPKRSSAKQTNLSYWMS